MGKFLMKGLNAGKDVGITWGFSHLRSGLLNLSTVDILDWIILCSGGGGRAILDIVRHLAASMVSTH